MQPFNHSQKNDSLPQRKPRVLIIAEEANPEWVSVPLVGWSTATALGAVAETHIVTQIRNSDAFARSALAADQYTIIDNEYLAAPIWKLAKVLRGGDGKGWTTITALKALVYWSFESEVWKRFGSDIKDGRFDIVHRVTPLTPTIPSPMARRCAKSGVPFVLGPLNGGVPWPKGFRHAQHKEREWLSYVRSAYKLLPGYRSTLTNSSALICASKHTLSEIPARLRDKCFYLPENAVTSSSLVEQPAAWDPGSPLKLIFVGRLVPYKGADMALDAAAPLLRDGRCTFDIVGDGPEMPSLRAKARELAVDDRTRFHGWLSHNDVMATLANCHAMLFPSIREFGGGVVLEAMARGVFPIVVDYGGPGELVTSDTAAAIPIGSRESIVAGCREALLRILEAPSALDAARRNGLSRCRGLFTWGAKANQIRRIYDWLLGGKQPDLDLLT
jgi:glycosyltransferase involved in cell wall biosynthesis